MNFNFRVATLDDVPQLESLIQLSARTLGRADYSELQIEAALQGAWGVDTQLIHDATCYAVEGEHGLVACGGWSRRKTLFGGDAHLAREPELLDPNNEAARIRAFFVHPHFARRGIGRMLLDLCEVAAKKEGFQNMELVATLPGVRLYERFGYVEIERMNHPLAGGIEIEFVKMRKASPLTSFSAACPPSPSA